MYNIEYLDIVVESDFFKIDKSDLKIIILNIEKKLSLNPFKYGKPLIGKLKTYYRLRIKGYRVIYTIKNTKLIVLVVAVGAKNRL